MKKLPPTLQTCCILLLFAIVGCQNGPKVINPEENDQTRDSENIFAPNPATMVNPPSDGDAFGEGLHRVTIQKVMPTERYVYLLANEAGHEFWIAARKQEVKEGDVYFYRGGLLKTNFESKEYNKVFDTMYLVSNLVSEDHSKHVSQMMPATDAKPAANPTKKEDIPTHTEKAVAHKGVVSIAELVKDPAKYEGHTIQISGTCVKINPNIMERNWIHLQDGSRNDYDLVITSSSFVPEGTKVTMKGVVNLNRDFGAGYTYDIILEDGIVLQ